MTPSDTLQLDTRQAVGLATSVGGPTSHTASRSGGSGWVGVCGGLAGDPLGARILTGLGVDELSISAQDVAPVKAALRGESRTAMQALAQRALRAGTADEVRAL